MIWTHPKWMGMREANRNYRILNVGIDESKHKQTKSRRRYGSQIKKRNKSMAKIELNIQATSIQVMHPSKVDENMKII
jgi:hypothetical protein